MSKATETLLFLANFNSWRRGDEAIEQPAPKEIGAAIDDAVNLLRRYDALERENAALRAENELQRFKTDTLATVTEERNRLRADNAALAGKENT